MKKLLVIGIIIYGAYNYFISSSPLNSFDEAGNPVTILFTINSCPPCDKARRYLTKRKVKFEEYNLNNDGSEAKNKLRQAGGGRQFPYLISGSQHISMYGKQSYTGFFAEVFGPDFLTPHERMLLKKNFNFGGQAKLVMYSTKTCGYCVKARSFFEKEKIAFTELFIDEDPEAKRHYQLLEGSGTPLIYVGYRRIEGFNEALLNATIKEKLTL